MYPGGFPWALNDCEMKKPTFAQKAVTILYYLQGKFVGLRPL